MALCTTLTYIYIPERETYQLLPRHFTEYFQTYVLERTIVRSLTTLKKKSNWQRDIYIYI